MQHITLTLPLTPEILEKLKVFTEEAEIKVAQDPVPAKVEPKKQETVELPFDEEPKAKVISKTDVRAKCLALSKAGKTDLLVSIFGEFGAKKLSDIKESDYPALMEKLGAANA